MKRNLSDSYSFYQNCYESELPIDQFYITKFDQLPSKFEHDADFDSLVETYFQNKGFDKEMQIYASSIRGIDSEKIMYVLKEKQIIISIENILKQELSDPYTKIIFYYNVKLGSLNSQFELKDLDNFILPEEKSNILLVKGERGVG